MTKEPYDSGKLLGYLEYYENNRSAVNFFKTMWKLFHMESGRK